MTAKQAPHCKEAPNDPKEIGPAIDAMLDFLAERAVLRESYGKAKPDPPDS